MEVSHEQLILVKGRMLAFIHGLAVVTGVIAILILADAVYNDAKFPKFLNNEGQNWTGRNSSGPINLRQVPWIEKEGEMQRGELDWVLLISLILVTLTHIALLIFLMFDIPPRKNSNSNSNSRSWSRRQLAEGRRGPGEGARPATTRFSAPTNINRKDRERESRSHNGYDKTAQRPEPTPDELDQDPNENKLGESAVVVSEEEDAADNNEPTSSSFPTSTKKQKQKEESLLTKEDHHGAPPRNRSQRKPDIESLDEPGKGKVKMSLPDTTHRKSSNFVLETVKARRRWRCHANVILSATFPMGTFTLFLIAGLWLEFSLVTQMNLFYKNTQSPTETFPFPGVCAIERRDDLCLYRTQADKYALDFISHGACNDYMLKLISSAISIGLVIISMLLVILYGMHYSQLSKAESKWFPVASLHEANDSLSNLRTGTTEGKRSIECDPPGPGNGRGVETGEIRWIQS